MLEVLLTELEDYAAAHHRAVVSPDAKKFLLFSTEFYQAGRKRLVGGFADRLKGMLSCTLLAILCDRIFLTEWLSPITLAEHFDAPHIAWGATSAILDVGEGDFFVADAIDNESFARFDQYLERNQTPELMFDGKKVAKLHTNILSFDRLLRKKTLLQQTSFGRVLAELCETDSIEAVARSLAPLLFFYNMRYRPMREATKMWRDFQSRRRLGPIIGVHFRSGGDGGWSDLYVDNIANVTNVGHAIKRVAERHREDKVDVFIASDSAKFRASLTDMISSQYAVISYTGNIHHYERSGGDALGDIDFAILEFMCLSRCNYVVHGAGGYGSTAALIGGKSSSHYSLIK